MILVTVGTQLPFDRLIRAVDSWAQRAGRRDLLLQIGTGGWRPTSGDWVEHLSPAQFREHVAQAELVVGHAGMGTLLIAQELGTPLLLLPRSRALREHRTAHQAATARQLEGRPGVTVAWDAAELELRLGEQQTRAPVAPLPSTAGPQFVRSLREFLVR